MLEAWRFGVLALVFGGLAIGGCAFGFGTSTHPVRWDVAFGTSPWMSPQRLLMARVLMGALFLSIYIWYVYDTWSDSWPYYLTHWSVTLETVYFVLLPIATHMAINSPSQEQPPFVGGMLALLHVQLPCSLAVVVLYWVLEKPAVKLCGISKEEGCEELPDFLGLFVHLYDAGLCTLSFCLGRIPFHLSNAGWLFVLTSAFTAWSAVHSLLQVFEGGAPLYDAIDWRTPGPVLQLLAALTAVAFPALVLLFRGVAWARDLVEGKAGLALAGPQAMTMMAQPMV